MNFSDLLHDLVIESLDGSTLHFVLGTELDYSIFRIIILVNLKESTFFPVKLNVQSDDCGFLGVNWGLLQGRILELRTLSFQLAPDILIRIVERWSHRHPWYSSGSLGPKLLVIKLERPNGASLIGLLDWNIRNVFE